MTPKKTGERGQQAKPTRTEVKAAWARLKGAAEQGSIEANALLIALCEQGLALRVDAPLAASASQDGTPK